MQQSVIQNSKHIIFFVLLVATQVIPNKLQAQERLYLIDTLVGKGSGFNERLYYAQGLGDINGDGYAELVVDSGDSTRIYFGNPEFELKTDIAFSGRKLFFAFGDINNDGYDDFLLGRNIYYGSALFDTSKGIPFSYPYFYMQSISRKVGNIGDVNGDGYKDFVISSPYNFDNGYSFVWLYLGGDTVTTEPFVTFYSSPWVEGNSVTSYGTSVTGIGDVNNDGYDDILISDPEYVVDTTTGELAGRVLLYYGGDKMDNIPDSILTNNRNEYLFGDELLRTKTKIYNKTNNLIIIGRPNICFYNNLTENYKINLMKFGLGGGISVASGGDLNNDGYYDFIIGNTNYKNGNEIMVGGAFIYYGNSDTLHDFKVEGEHKWDQFAYKTDFIGDFNGDGYDDFIIFSPQYPDYRDYNQKGKIYMYSYKNYTGIENKEENTTKRFELYQNYPNPFNPSTIISYNLPSEAEITIKVINTLGQEVATLINSYKKAGKYKVEFNANKYGLSSGIYFVKMNINNRNTITKKIVLIK